MLVQLVGERRSFNPRAMAEAGRLGEEFPVRRHQASLKGMVHICWGGQKTAQLGQWPAQAYQPAKGWEKAEGAFLPCKTELEPISSYRRFILFGHEKERRQPLPSLSTPARAGGQGIMGRKGSIMQW